MESEMNASEWEAFVQGLSEQDLVNILFPQCKIMMDFGPSSFELADIDAPHIEEKEVKRDEDGYSKDWMRRLTKNKATRKYKRGPYLKTREKLRSDKGKRRTNRPKNIKCELCPKDKPYTTLRISDYYEHLQYIHNRTIYRCDQCSFQGENFAIFESHYLLNHMTDGPVFLQKSIVFRCTECNDSFHTAEDFKKHMLMEFDKRSMLVKCEQCDCKFFNTCIKKQHLIFNHNLFDMSFQ
jgi:hypothetical protein